MKNFVGGNGVNGSTTQNSGVLLVYQQLPGRQYTEVKSDLKSLFKTF